MLKATEPKETVHIYSYELKKKIESDYQLKQCYFQALSNSSWANYGYLVTFEINEDLDEEMKRLNNAFGIGINFSTFIAQLSKVINASKEYDVVIGNGVLAELGERCVSLLGKGRAVIVTDSNVAPLWLAEAKESLEKQINIY